MSDQDKQSNNNPTNHPDKTTTVASILHQFDRYDSTSIETSEDNSHEHVYQFTPKFQNSTKNNPLCGICWRPWIQLLWKRRHQIQWLHYWPRLVVVTLLSILNSLLALPEYWWYESQIQATEIPSRPVFILGHPRTGTTLLHSLLALDEEQFFVCTTFCAGFPSCFLWLENIGKILFRHVIDKTRPMDNVPLHFDLPQEDELATNVLCAGDAVSPYMPLWFMTSEPEFRPYYAFAIPEDHHHDPNDPNNASSCNHDDDCYLPPDQMSRAKRIWTTSFLYLLRKLTLRATTRNGTGKSSTTTAPTPRRLLLKSPVHTARMALLLQLFPDAQFLYIHRHPYDVFRSAAHMADTTYWYTYLATPTNEQIQEFILRQYEILWQRYQQDKQALALTTPTDSSSPILMEVSYDELSQQPMATVERIYQQMGWKLSNQYRQALLADIGERSDYQVNHHKPLPPGLHSIINERWSDSFAVLGYEKQEL